MSNTLEASQKPLPEFRENLGNNTLSADAHRIIQGLFEQLAGFGSALENNRLPPNPSSPPGGSYAVVTVQRVTTELTIPAGAIYVEVQNIHATENGSVMGTTLEPGQRLAFPVTYNLLLPAIAIVGTGTALLVTHERPPV